MYISAAALRGEDILAEISQNFKFDPQNALVEVPCEHLGKHCRFQRTPEKPITRYDSSFNVSQLPKLLAIPSWTQAL